MPYKLAKRGKGWVVVTSSGPNKGHVHSNHPLSKLTALAQMRALYANEKDAK